MSYDDINNLDEILNEVKLLKDNKDNITDNTDEPSKEWSVEDIDRLIAKANGEDYVPRVKKEDMTPAENFDEILNRDFDSDLFTVRPFASEKEEEEIEDISSGNQPEMEGQEVLYEQDFDDDFSVVDLELETVIMPEDEPASTDKYTSVKQYIDSLFEEDKFAKKYFEESSQTETVLDDAPIEVKDYKERFLSKIKLENTVELEIEPTGPIDKFGIVISKGDEIPEDGLEPMPKVLAAEDVADAEDEKTKVVNKTEEPRQEKENNDNVEGQIVLNGFTDIDDESMPVKTSEIDIENDLATKRKEKAESFKLDDFDDEFEEYDNLPDTEGYKVGENSEKEKDKKEDTKEKESFDYLLEYNDPSERNAINSKLSNLATKAAKKVLTLGIIEVIAFVLNLMPSLCDKLNIETSLFSTEGLTICVLNLILLIAAVVVFSEQIINGLLNFVRGDADSNSVVAVSAIVAVLHNAIGMVSSTKTGIFFGSAAIFGMLISAVADMFDAQRTYENFSICAFKYDHGMSAIHNIENEAEIFELGRGILMGNPAILYSSTIDFPSDFVKTSEKKCENKRTVLLITLISIVISFVAAIVFGIKTSSFIGATSLFACAFCASVPVLVRFIPSFALYTTNHKLNEEGTMIASMESAETVAESNAVVLNSADIFDKNKCMMHGMKDFKNIRVDDVLLYAAAMVMKSGGPLKECFANVVDGREDLLPPIKELVYEDKLGIAARIYNQKVLLGNRNMLIHHNIEVPDESLERKYTYDGRKVIYLACNEKVAALFVVSYCVDEGMKTYLRTLENNGIQILIRTNDVNVTEQLIADSFGLNQQNFKILSSVASRLYKRRKDAIIESFPAGVIHNGKTDTFMRTITACCNLVSQNKMSTILEAVFAVIGVIISLALMSGDFGTFTGTFCTIYLILTALISAGIMSLRSKLK